MVALRPALVFAAVVVTSYSSARATDLGLRLSANKTECRVGDTVRFRLIEQNVASHPISCIPTLPDVESGLLTARNVSMHRAAESILLGEDATYFEGFADDARVLKPGAHLERSVVAKVARFLPPEYGRKEPGLFLVLRGCALSLPGPGDYKLFAQIYSSRGTPWERRLRAIRPDAPRLWTGHTRSNMIILDFKAAPPSNHALQPTASRRE